MSRQESMESERDSNDSRAKPPAAAAVPGGGGYVRGHYHPSASTSPIPPSSSAYAQQQQQHYSFVDPNVMAVSNTAATIAAVAASALQQITKAKGHHHPPSLTAAGAGHHTTSSVNPALVAALGGQSLLPSAVHHHSHAAAATPSVPPHLVALLAGGSPVNAAAAASLHHGAAATTPTSIHSGIHQALTNPGGAALDTKKFNAAASGHATGGSISNALLPNMQSWTLEQLEQHVSLLKQLNQPVPQSVALLLADAQRKEKKRKAKRVANRKSASTSRARKKALVEEMTKINARLKRQALILALLPDLVIAITTDGHITFCSDQVQKVLMYSLDDLMGAKLTSLIAPSSRDVLINLIKDVIKSDIRQASSSRHGQPSQEHVASKRRRSSNQRNPSDTNASKATVGGDKDASNDDSRRGSSNATSGSGGDTSAAAVVSDQSFPLSVVEVESKRSAVGSTAVAPPGPSHAANAETNLNSDSSTSKGGKQQLSSLTNSAGRSPTASSYEDEGGRRSGGSRDSGRAGGSGTKRKSHSSDDSSSLSSEAKNMSKANDNLDRNVRWHNQRMLEDTKKGKTDFGPKDDVTGASVTANNASARLSSLKHDPFISAKNKDEKGYERNEDQSSSDDSLLAGVEEKKKTENVSDDSGYRESNDSREETSSSGSDTSNSNEHRKKLASTCKICLIRNDLSTVWCEVTSSVRTRSSDEDFDAAGGDTESQDINPSATGHTPKVEVKELLLCLRPIRDGDKVDDAYRFVPQKKMNVEMDQTSTEKAGIAGVVSSSGSGGCHNDDKTSMEKNSAGSRSTTNSAGTSSSSSPKRPPKKRPLPRPDNESPGDNQNETTSRKKSKGSPSNDTEKSVVESLMLMNKSQ